MPANQNVGVAMDGIYLDENDLSDTNLMTAIGAGDAPAGNIFISHHLSYVMSICRHYLKNEAEAEEAAQDVFAAIWRKADQFAQSDWRTKASLARGLCRLAGGQTIRD